MSTRTLLRALASAYCGVLLLVSGPARGTTYTFSGSLGGTRPIAAEATLEISGTLLTLTLTNNSPTPTTLYGEQVLTSFYFDMIFDGGARPTLTYTSGSGNVYRLTGGGAAALPYLYVPPSTNPTPPYYTGPLAGPQPSDIKVVGKGDYSWMFRGDLDVTKQPFTKFGIGTVGNSDLAPNGFNSQFVDQIDFGIFNGDGSDPEGDLKSRLPNLYLVSKSATFTFTSDMDLTNAKLNDPFVFGFGTAPSQRITVAPEPDGRLALAAAAASAIWWVIGRRRRTGSPAPPASAGSAA